MGKYEDVAAALNVETNSLAATTDAIREQVLTSIANKQVLDPAIPGKLAAIVERLRVLGSDPSNPVPAPVPAVLTPIETPPAAPVVAETVPELETSEPAPVPV